MTRLIIELLDDRDFCGHLSLITGAGERVCGPYPVAGRSSDPIAAAHRNPQRDRLSPFGDTPLGEYKIKRFIAMEGASPADLSRLGANPVIVLAPTGGDAAMAARLGRDEIWIHGGDSSPLGLVATAGSLRLADEHQAALVAALAEGEHPKCECRSSLNDGPDRVITSLPEGWQNLSQPYHVRYVRRAVLARLAGAAASVAAATAPAAAAPIDPGDSGDLSDTDPGGASPPTGDPCATPNPQPSGKVQPAVPPDTHFSAGIGADVNQAWLWQSEGFVLRPTLTNGGLPTSQGKNSGVTVAHGVDLGQTTESEMISNLTTYAGLSVAAAQALAQKFTGAYGISSTQAQTWLSTHPGQIALTAAEANAVDQAYNGAFVNDIANQYNSDFGDGAFQALDGNVQTILLDLGYPMGLYGTGQNGHPVGLFNSQLWQQVGTQNFDQALANLNNFTPVGKNSQGVLVGSKSDLGMRAQNDANLLVQAQNCGRVQQPDPPPPPVPPSADDPSDPVDVSAIPESQPNTDPYGGYTGADPYAGIPTDPYGGVGGDPNNSTVTGSDPSSGGGGGGGVGTDPSWSTDPTYDPPLPP